MLLSSLVARVSMRVALMPIHSQRLLTRSLPLLVLLGASACRTAEPDACNDFAVRESAHGCGEHGDPWTLDERTAPAVARSPYARLALTQDATHLYWSACSGDVLRTPKAAGESSVLVPADACSVTGIAVVGAQTFVLRTCSVGVELLSVPTEGGASTLLVSGAGSSGSLIVASGHLLFTQRDGETSSALWVREIAADAPPQRVVEVEGPYLPFTVHAGTIYWANGRMLMKRPLEGGPGMFVAQLDRTLETFVPGTADVRWLGLGERVDPDLEPRSLWRLSATGVAEQVAEGPFTKLVVADGDELFGVGFLEQGTVAPRLYQWSSSVGGAPETFAASLAWSEAVVLDADAVYWIDRELACESTRLLRAER